MAKLYITEYQRPQDSPTFPMQAAFEGGHVIEQTPVAIGGTTAQSAAFNANTRFVRIHTDAICSIRFGANPTATVNTARMAANQTEYFGVSPGDKVAVISNT